MKISEMIAQLELYKQEYGDIEFVSMLPSADEDESPEVFYGGQLVYATFGDTEEEAESADHEAIAIIYHLEGFEESAPELPKGNKGHLN